MFTKNQIAQFLFNKNYAELNSEELEEFNLKTIAVKVEGVIIGYYVVGSGGGTCRSSMRDT